MATLRVILLYLLYIVLIGSITAAIVFSLRSNHQPKVATTQPSHTQTQAEQGTSTSSSGNQSNTAQSSAGSAANAGASTGQNVASGTGSKSTSSSDQLANTGPGSDVALFLAATLIGTYVYRRRLVKASL